MKKFGLMLGVAFVLQGCSGVAPEAQRDENNELLKPPFLAADKTAAKATRRTIMFQRVYNQILSYCGASVGHVDSWQQLAFVESSISPIPPDVLLIPMMISKKL
jgi:hypothetical protein